MTRYNKYATGEPVRQIRGDKPSSPPSVYGYQAPLKSLEGLNTRSADLRMKIVTKLGQLSQQQKVAMIKEPPKILQHVHT